jgi:hypothetical protein
MLRASRYLGFAGVSRKGNKVSTFLGVINVDGSNQTSLVPSNYAMHLALKCSFPFRVNGDV